MGSDVLTPLHPDGTVREFVASEPVYVVNAPWGNRGRVVGYDPRGYVRVAFVNPFLAEGAESVLCCLPLALTVQS